MDVRTGVINQDFPKQTDKDISYLEVELTIPFSMCFFLPCGQLLPPYLLYCVEIISFYVSLSYNVLED